MARVRMDAVHEWRRKAISCFHSSTTDDLKSHLISWTNASSMCHWNSAELLLTSRAKIHKHSGLRESPQLPVVFTEDHEVLLPTFKLSQGLSCWNIFGTNFSHTLQPNYCQYRVLIGFFLMYQKFRLESVGFSHRDPDSENYLPAHAEDTLSMFKYLRVKNSLPILSITFA